MRQNNVHSDIFSTLKQKQIKAQVVTVDTAVYM